MWLHYPLLRSLDTYKVHLCFIVLSVTVGTVGYICLFHGDQIFVDFVSFLSMIIYEVLHTWCLRYNICSAWFLDIRISTCYGCFSASMLKKWQPERRNFRIGWFLFTLIFVGCFCQWYCFNGNLMVINSITA